MACNRISFSVLLLATVLFLSQPAYAFGAGYVSRGSHLKGTNFRHGDIALAVPLLATANRRLVKQIYFGNWLRDFSQIVDKTSLALTPYPILRALVAVFAFVQFGYATREFEVTNERLGFYRPEEHVDNPRGYDGATAADEPKDESEREGYRISEGLRPGVHPNELAIDPKTGMKNYIANAEEVGGINPTSAEYVEKQLVAAIASGRQGSDEAYIHLGAALHTLEDFVAHSNYVELTMQLIGTEMKDQANIFPALSKVFAYCGGGASVNMERGGAAPITTGTFGALDLIHTLLGEIDDRLAAMSLPGIELRTSSDGGALERIGKSLMSLLSPLTKGFEKEILSVQKSTMKTKPTWGDLESKPEALWESLEPVFKLRDDVVKWVNDNLKIRAVQDAVAAISAAIDKLVYMVLGVVLGPLLREFSRVLKDQEQQLSVLDQRARQASGEDNIFVSSSTDTDPTHSQLAKDHYDHVLNEIAGRVAVRISSYTITQVIQLWQPGNTTDPRPVLASILQTFHHPFQQSSNSAIQTLMYNEVSEYVTSQFMTNTKSFEEDLQSLSASAAAARAHEHAPAAPTGTSHRDELTAVHKPDSIARRSAHDLVTTQRPEVRRGFIERVSDNVERQLQDGPINGVGLDAFGDVKKLLFAPPSGDTPNPLDSGLAKLSGISYLGTFEGIGIDEIAAADGMGETLKDAVISMILLDEKRGVQEEEVAATRFGWGKTDAEKEERRRLKEMQKLLKIETMETKQEEGQFEEKRGVKDSLKEGIEKLKLKARSDG